MIRNRTRTLSSLLALAALGATSACAGVIGTPQSSEPAPSTTTTPTQTTTGNWPVRTAEQVDLWLHGYAMLQRDTARVPFFKRGYRDRMIALRRQRGVTSLLDSNMARLTQQLERSPALVNGQFLPLYFDSWQAMRQLLDAFVRAQGNPRAASDQQTAAYFQLVAASFPTPADREWLATFVRSLEDERVRFYDDYWTGEQRARAPVYAAIDTLWRTRERARLQTYLNNTRQETGELILSLPLDGEGRTVNRTNRDNSIAVSYPDDVAHAVDAIYVFVHEAINAVVNPAIADNTTPAQQRAGVVAAISANATVRGGAMLLERAAPDLVAGYMRYYLQSAGVSPGSDLRATFASTFSLPDAIRDAIGRQLDSVLAGI